MEMYPYPGLSISGIFTKRSGRLKQDVIDREFEPGPTKEDGNLRKQGGRCKCLKWPKNMGDLVVPYSKLVLLCCDNGLCKRIHAIETCSLCSWLIWHYSGQVQRLHASSSSCSSRYGWARSAGKVS